MPKIAARKDFKGGLDLATQGVALITGGSRGIGLGTARVMGVRGWSIAISGTNESRLSAARTALQTVGIKPLCLCFRAEEASAWPRALSEIDKTFGGLTALVCNAGISPKVSGRKVPFEETNDELWKQTFDVNVTGVLSGFRAATKYFLQRGTSGAMVAVSSIAARVHVPLTSSYYTTAKAAVLGLVRGAAFDLGHHGIRVNAVAPGRIDTDMVREAGSAINNSLLPEIALRRLGYPDEVGEVIEFLCSSRAAYVTGTCVDVTGGWMMS